MADKLYNPPPPPPNLATCPRCGSPVVAHGVGNGFARATWRYACQQARRAWKGRTCTWTATVELEPRPAAIPALREELRGLAKDSKLNQLRTVAEMLGNIPEDLLGKLPKGEITQELAADLLELSNHARAAGLRLEMLLLRELSKKGIGPGTAAVLKAWK